MLREREYELLGELEEELEAAGDLEFEQEDGPYDWPQRTRLRLPPPAIIPSGPYTTLPTCRAVYGDLADLVAALGVVRGVQRQRPLDRHRLRNAQIDRDAALRRMRLRAQTGWYDRQGCSRANLNWLARQINSEHRIGALTRNSLVRIIRGAANRARP